MSINILCRPCGLRVPVMPADVEVHSATRTPSSGGTYTFICPRCGTTMRERASSYLLFVLRRAGARDVVLHVSRRGARLGDPFNYDDLLDFHLLLQQPDWLTQLESAESPRANGGERYASAL